MRMLVTGQAGQVATSLSRLGTEQDPVFAIGRPELDLLDSGSIAQAIQRYRPDVVVNAAAYTAVDLAETEQQAAFAVNRDGAGKVAAAAAAADLPIIQISTDYVFSGDKADAYVETDIASPLGVYGQSKLEGEQLVAQANARHVILRTSWVYGPHGKNFLLTMLRLARDRDLVRVVADQRGSPTSSADIAEGIRVVAGRITDRPEALDWRGIFHMTARDSTSWAGFAEAILAASAARGGPHATVEAITTAQYPTPARRPTNSVLSSQKYAAVFGHALPIWRDSLPACIAEVLHAPDAPKER